MSRELRGGGVWGRFNHTGQGDEGEGQREGRKSFSGVCPETYSLHTKLRSYPSPSEVIMVDSCDTAAVCGM